MNFKIINNCNFFIFDNIQELADNLAKEIIDEIQDKKSRDKDLFLTLSGGSTPKILFKSLSDISFEKKISWENCNIFWSDERCVPPDNNKSNYGMTKKILLDKISIPEQNIHRIKGEDEPIKEADRYAKEIKKIIPLDKSETPVIDWILLGMGEDGHTASLFPNQHLRHISLNIAGVAFHPQTKQNRISLTYEVINNSKRIIFLITGREKSFTLTGVIKKKNKYPASKILLKDRAVEFYIDKDAASQLLK